MLLAGSAVAVGQGQKVTRENRQPSEIERDNPQERAQWFLRGRTVNGKPAPELLHKAYQQKLNNRRLHEAARVAEARTSTSSSTATTPSQSAATPTPNFISTTGGASWVPFGPAPSGTASVGDLDQDYGPAIGRTTVVVVDQSDTTGNTVYIGGASGGLWKSTNAANTNVQNCNTVSISQAPYCAPSVTWTPLIDQQASLTVGAMAIKPGNPQWLVVGTGEANNSADSYYGLGFLISQDGGSTWSLVSSAKSADGTSTIDLHGLGTSHLAFSTENISGQNLTTSTVVATMAAAAGGLAVGAEFAGSTARGIYFSKDAGLTWQRATVTDGAAIPDAGSANAVIYNPFTHLFYANIRYHGLYSSPDGQNWTRLTVQPGGSLLSLTACPSTPFSTGCPLYRAEMAIVPGRAGANNNGEMYVWIVNNADTNEGMFETTDGGATWTQISTTGIDNCGDGGSGACGTTQGSYNLTLLAVPNGSAATDLYAGTVNQYRCNIDPVLNPTCATKAFTNLTHTYGSCGTATTGAFAHVHPDQHGIDFVQAKPQLIYFGNDGGIYRTLNSFDTRTQSCVTSTDPWIQYDNLGGTMGSMIQFVWFSQNPSDANTLLGGTQDNGTMAKNGSSLATALGNGSAAGYSWQSVNNGDGGFNDINPISPQEWFVSNPHVSVQQCINGSGITCTASTFNEIVNSSKLGSDSASFYMPYMLDPQATTHLLVGTCRLWRVDRNSNLATTWPNAVALTYNLDEFGAGGTAACSSNASNKISAIAAGGTCKGVCNTATNGSGNGSQVIYLGTEAGRVFVTTNSDAGFLTWSDRTNGLPSTLNCDNAPCPVSAIAIDPTDATGNTAYVTLMGFKIGHVFKTTNAGATWTNIDGNSAGNGLPDAPADAVAIDPNVSGLIYVATDVGVFKSIGDGNWTEVGPTTGAGMLPNVATTALRVFGTGANTHLRVSTYGRGIWDIPIPHAADFSLSLTSSTAVAPPNTAATISGTVNPTSNHTTTVTLSCASVTAGASCSISPTSFIGAAAGSFVVSLSAATTGTYSATVVATDSDTTIAVKQATISFKVADYSIATANPQMTVAAGVTGSATINVSASVGFPTTISFDSNTGNGCSGLPNLATCTFSPVTVDPSTGQTSSSLTVTTQATRTIGAAGHNSRTPFAPWFALAGVAAVVFVAGGGKPGGKNRKWIVLALVILAAQLGCGGGGGSTTTTQSTVVAGTPAGTYPITVKASATIGSTVVTKTTTVTLVVN